MHISRRAAEEYMRAYNCFADLPAELTGQFTAKALYRLSAPGSPEDAPEAAIQKARQGIRITEKSAKALLDELTPKEPTAADPVEPWNEPAEPNPTEEKAGPAPQESQNTDAGAN